MPDCIEDGRENRHALPCLRSCRRRASAPSVASLRERSQAHDHHASRRSPGQRRIADLEGAVSRHAVCNAVHPLGATAPHSRRPPMKKILLGFVAALALAAFTTPAHAEGDAAGGDKPADAKPAKGKKGKKGKKDAAGDAAGGDAAGGDATKKK